MNFRLWARACLLAALLAGSSAATFSWGEQSEVIGSVAEAELPKEARETLALIHRGGPFPYARDGTVFSNREGLLPRAPKGTYREYTVRTPGSRDRGARRIVHSRNGEFFYTADHYRSFRRILE